MSEISEKGYNIMQRALDQAAGRFGDIIWLGNPQDILRNYITELETLVRLAVGGIVVNAFALCKYDETVETSQAGYDYIERARKALDNA